MDSIPELSEKYKMGSRSFLDTHLFGLGMSFGFWGLGSKLRPLKQPLWIPQQYGFHNSGAGAEGARPTVVEAAEGRLHNGGWEGGKHSHTSNPR